MTRRPLGLEQGGHLMDAQPAQRSLSRLSTAGSSTRHRDGRPPPSSTRSCASASGVFPIATKSWATKARSRQLWGLLPEQVAPGIAAPEWAHFMRGGVAYRASLDAQAPDAPRTGTGCCA